MIKYLKPREWPINLNMIMTLLMLVIVSCDSNSNQKTFDVEDDNLGLILEDRNISLRNKSDLDIYLFAVTAELATVINWAPIIDGMPDLVSKETKSFKVDGSDDVNSSRYIVYYWFESDDVDKDSRSDHVSAIYVDL